MIIEYGIQIYLNARVKYCFYVFSILSFVQSQDAVVTQLTEPFQLAEGPFWDDVYQKLYFVDIDGKTVHRLDPFTKEEQVLHFGNLF